VWHVVTLHLLTATKSTRIRGAHIGQLLSGSRSSARRQTGEKEKEE